jgi:hypothetical protein
MSTSTFNSVTFPAFKPKGVVDKVAVIHEMMLRANINQKLVELDNQLEFGLITKKEFELEMELFMKNLKGFSSESWEDIIWTNSTLPNETTDWRDIVDWRAPKSTNQAEDALKFLRGLATGSISTELDATFLLPPKFLRQVLAATGNQHTQEMEGFGEGPYPILQSIITPTVIEEHLNLQLHTIFEAWEDSLEGAPDDHDEDEDHEDHDDFQTIIEKFSPYIPFTYGVWQDTSEGDNIIGEFLELELAEELANKYNNTYIEEIPPVNGAYRGVSRVIFDDGSDLTFIILGDLIHSSGEFVNMSSAFILPHPHKPNSKWWDFRKTNN